MNRPSIRVRLTAWYSLLLAVAMVAFAVMEIAMTRRSIYETVDEQLADDAKYVQQLLTAPGVQPGSGRRQSSAELQPGSLLFQVADDTGGMVYSSPAMEGLRVPSSVPESGTFETLQIHNSPLRVYSTQVVDRGRTYRLQVAYDLDDFVEATNHYESLMWIGIPLLLAGAALAGYWLSGLALAPVNAMTQAAREIHPLNLTARVASPGTHDELDALAATLNAMLQRIEGAFDRIRLFTVNASHELRTPVAIVRSRAEIALRRPRTELDYRAALQDILSESEHISSLLEELMLLARQDVGSETLNFSRLDLVAVANEVCREGQILAESRHLGWSQNLPGGAAWVEGNRDGLRRLFLILIDNAVKYTSEPGCVHVGVLAQNGRVRIDIRDTGIGISPVDLPNIFERFYRSQAARSDGYVGAGLGLAIGQWIARAHGAEITVETEAGTGTCFQVSFPLVI